ncbi:uncharacterized protein LOC135923945 [Gordionus sp. m RMFG-2023]|uniref:uncharacterized protein LOC135923945 n=1 Tax=Gordionus sp. m RMFG-2023 TaxID=3053472 RepID=UPI0031FC2CB1
MLNYINFLEKIILGKHVKYISRYFPILQAQDTTGDNLHQILSYQIIKGFCKLFLFKRTADFSLLKILILLSSNTIDNEDTTRKTVKNQSLLIQKFLEIFSYNTKLNQLFVTAVCCDILKDLVFLDIPTQISKTPNVMGNNDEDGNLNDPENNMEVNILSKYCNEKELDKISVYSIQILRLVNIENLLKFISDICNPDKLKPETESVHHSSPVIINTQLSPHGYLAETLSQHMIHLNQLILDTDYPEVMGANAIDEYVEKLSTNHIDNDESLNNVDSTLTESKTHNATLTDALSTTLTEIRSAKKSKNVLEDYLDKITLRSLAKFLSNLNLSRDAFNCLIKIKDAWENLDIEHFNDKQAKKWILKFVTSFN